jgi:fibronectin-binding autotransporter adhesin
MSTLDFADHTGYLHLGGFSTVNAGVTGTAGLAVAGNGTVQFNTTNPLTGGLAVNGTATVRFSADGQLGAAGGGITLDGGTLNYTATAPLALSRPLTVTAAGGTITGAGPLALDLTGSTGPGCLTLSSGTFQLTGTAGYAGRTSVGGGATVQFTGDQNFGAGPVVLAGTLQSLSDAAFGKAIVVGSVSTIDTGAFNPTYTGAIQGATSTLTKKGTGTLTITAPQPLTGDVLVSAGGLTLAGNGRFDNLASFRVAAGATTTLDDSAGNVAGRLPAQVGLLGGELVVRGNSAGTGEAIGTLALLVGGNSVVTLRPAAGPPSRWPPAGWMPSRSATRSPECSWSAARTWAGPGRTAPGSRSPRRH